MLRSLLILMLGLLSACHSPGPSYEERDAPQEGVRPVLSDRFVKERNGTWAALLIDDPRNRDHAGFLLPADAVAENRGVPSRDAVYFANQAELCHLVLLARKKGDRFILCKEKHPGLAAFDVRTLGETDLARGEASANRVLPTKTTSPRQWWAFRVLAFSDSTAGLAVPDSGNPSATCMKLNAALFFRDWDEFERFAATGIDLNVATGVHEPAWYHYVDGICEPFRPEDVPTRWRE